MFEDSMTAFKALDGTLNKEFEEKNGRKPSAEEIQNTTKEAIETAAQKCVNAIRIYEPIWRETYAAAVTYMRENPLRPAEEKTEEGNA